MVKKKLIVIVVFGIFIWQSFALDTSGITSKCLGQVLVYIDKAKGMVTGNVFLDLNTDGKYQDNEAIPENLLSKESNTALFDYFLSKIDSFNKAKLKSIGDSLSADTISAKDAYGSFDKLGSYLSANGIHPFKNQKIYYLPNGSGDKFYLRRLDLYPNGVPRLINIDETKYEYIDVTIPNEPNKIRIWIYGSDRIKQFDADAKKYGYNAANLYNLNRIQFYQSGKMQSIGVFPYMVIPMPEYIGCMEKESSMHGIDWLEDGRIKGINEADKAFRIRDDIIVNQPRSIYYNYKQEGYSFGWNKEKTYTFCYTLVYVSEPVKILMKKGSHTLYHMTNSKTSSDGKEWTPYEKIFDVDTEVSVAGGLWIDLNGVITNYF